MNEIQSITHTIIKNYSGKTLKNILEILPNANHFSHEGVYCFSKKTKNKILEILSYAQKNDVLCLQSDGLNDRDILDELEKAIRNGVNVYIVLDSISQEIEKFSNKAQVRAGVKCEGSLVILNSQSNQSRGLLFQSSFSAQELDLGLYYSLLLSENQIQDLFQFFCYLFWNKSTQSLSEGNAVPQSPFGEIGLPFRLYPFDELQNLFEMERGLYSFQNLTKEFLSFHSLPSKSKILVSLLGNEKQVIEKLGAESDIYFTSKDKPNLLPFLVYENRNEGYWIQKLDQEQPYLLELSNDQVRELREAFDKGLKTAGARFFANVAYSQLQNSFKVYGEDQEKKIEARKSFSVRLILSLERLKKLKESPEQISEILLQEMKEKKPEWAEPLALEVEYNIQASPISIPKNSTKDKLQTDWEEIQKKFLSKIEEAIQTSNQIEDLKKGLTGRVWDGLKSFFAGKEQKKSERQRELEELKEKNLIHDVEPNKLVQKLNEIIEAINNDLNDVAEQIRVEQEKERLENKKKEFENEIHSLEERLKEKQNELEELEAKISKELSELEKERDGLDEQGRKEIDEKIEIYKNSKAQEKNKLNEEIKELNSKIESFNIKLQNLKLEEIQKKEKQESTLTTLRSTSQTSSTKEAKISVFQVKWPNESLPDVGVLYYHNSRRYLAIQTWDEFEKAEEEAKRLKATLCILE